MCLMPACVRDEAVETVGVDVPEDSGVSAIGAISDKSDQLSNIGREVRSRGSVDKLVNTNHDCSEVGMYQAKDRVEGPRTSTDGRLNSVLLTL